MEKDFISVLPSEFFPENLNTLQWGSCNAITFATGSTVHFFYFHNDEISRLYSVDFRPAQILAISFHEHLPHIAIGDSLGRIFLYDIENRLTLFSYTPNFPETKCIYIQIYGNTIYALFSNSKFLAIQHSRDVKTETLTNAIILWDLNLSNQFSRFSLTSLSNPEKLSIAFSGDSNIFSIFTSTLSIFPERSTPSLPVPIFNHATLTEPDPIIDIQWSLHFPNFLILVTESRVTLFSTVTQNVIPLIINSTFNSPITHILQQDSDHSILLSLHKNGSLNFHISDLSMKYSTATSIEPKRSMSPILQIAGSLIIDNRILALISGCGLSIIKYSPIHFSPIVYSTYFNYPAHINSISSNEDMYALGTITGHVIVGNFRGNENPKRFSVSENKIDYLVLSKSRNRVYFLSDGKIGRIWINFGQQKNANHHNVVEYFPTHGGPIKKCDISSLGIILVQHAPRVLGLILPHLREKAIIFDDDIIDFSINSLYSTVLPKPSSEEPEDITTSAKNEENGIEKLGFGYDGKRQLIKIAVLLNGQKIQLIEVEGSKIKRSNLPMYNTSTVNGTAINWTGQMLTICFPDLIASYNIMETREKKKWDFVSFPFKTASSLRRMGPFLFGITDNRLFKFDGSNASIFEGISNFSFASNGLLLVLMSSDNSAHLVTSNNFKCLSTPNAVAESSVLSFPRQNQIYATFAREFPRNLWISTLSKHIWICVLSSIQLEHQSNSDNITSKSGTQSTNDKLKFDDDILTDYKPPMNLMYRYGAGLSDEYIRSLFFLYQKMASTAPGYDDLFFSTALSAGEFDAAAASISNGSRDSSSDICVFNAALSSCIIAVSDCKQSGQLSERVQVQMKSSAALLFSRDRFEQGAVFLRVAGLDYELFSAYFENRQYDNAMAVLRDNLKGIEKKTAALRFAIKYWKQGDTKRAMPFLALSGEFHLLLHLMERNEMWFEAFFIQKMLLKKKCLKGCDDSVRRQISANGIHDEIPDVETLSAIINGCFVEFGHGVFSPEEIANLII